MQQIKKLFYRNGKSYFSYVMIPVLFLVLMAAFQLDLINTYWQTIILLSGINGIVAMSLNLINGITGQSCLGQAGFMSIGAYVSAMCTKLVFDGFMTNGFSSYLFFILSLLIGGAAASLIGLLIGIPSLRLRGDYLAIVTLGFSEIIRVAWRVIPPAGRAMGLNTIPKLSTLPMVFISVVIVMLVLRNFTNSRFGRSCIAVRENELAGETMGINTTRIKVLAFVLSAFIAGVGGGLYAHMMTFINPDTFNQIKSTDMVLYLYAGGVGSFSSALLGATVFSFLPEVLRSLGEWRLVIYSLSLVLIMINRPKGIFGKHEFGFMRYGEPENIHMKAENSGILSSLFQKLAYRRRKAERAPAAGKGDQ